MPRRSAADHVARADAEAVIQCWNNQLAPRPGHAVVADDPGHATRRHAVGRCLLSRVRH
jgi:hypothetical protein